MHAKASASAELSPSLKLVGTYVRLKGVAVTPSSRVRRTPGTEKPEGRDWRSLWSLGLFILYFSLFTRLSIQSFVLSSPFSLLTYRPLLLCLLGLCPA